MTTLLGHGHGHLRVKIEISHIPQGFIITANGIPLFKTGSWNSNAMWPPSLSFLGPTPGYMKKHMFQQFGQPYLVYLKENQRRSVLYVYFILLYLCDSFLFFWGEGPQIQLKYPCPNCYGDGPCQEPSQGSLAMPTNL